MKKFIRKYHLYIPKYSRNIKIIPGQSLSERDEDKINFDVETATVMLPIVLILLGILLTIVIHKYC